jgi:hypothetical protein
MAQHAHRLATSLDAPGKAAVSVPRDELLLHHVHMTHNRLGFPPPEEAALTLVAQALTRRQPEP